MSDPRFRDDPIPLSLDQDDAAAEWLDHTRWQGSRPPWRHGTPIPTHQRDMVYDDTLPRCEFCDAPLDAEGPPCHCPGNQADIEQERLDIRDHLRRDGGV